MAGIKALQSDPLFFASRPKPGRDFPDDCAVSEALEDHHF
jgi:hypothetical protein